MGVKRGGLVLGLSAVVWCLGEVRWAWCRGEARWPGVG